MAEDSRRLSIRIVYCTKCHFLPRAAWVAQELLHTFADYTAEVALVPSNGGRFEVWINGDEVFSTKKNGRFPEMRELREIAGGYLEEGWKSRHDAQP